MTRRTVQGKLCENELCPGYFPWHGTNVLSPAGSWVISCLFQHPYLHENHIALSAGRTGFIFIHRLWSLRDFSYVSLLLMLLNFFCVCDELMFAPIPRTLKSSILCSEISSLFLFQF